MLLFFRWAPPVLWMGVIFYLSDQSGESLDAYIPFFQRLIPGMQSFDWGHLAAYFILALLFYAALGPRFSGWKGQTGVVAICFLYGISDEFHQMFVPGRMADGYDLLNDTIGAALAMLVANLPVPRRMYERWWAIWQKDKEKDG